MAVPTVNKKLLSELEAMGFPLAHATRALHYSGNASLEAAVNWFVDHEKDSDIDQMPLVPMEIAIESPTASPIREEMKTKEQELRDRARKKEEEKKLEREREKERIRAGKELLEAKRISEESERKRAAAMRIVEKEEEKKAKEKILQKLDEDKANRRRKLGLPPENLAAIKPSTTDVQEKRNSFPLMSSNEAERMSECLRSLRRNHKDDYARVRRAFQTLLIYVRNVAKNPNEEKFRKIRVNNPCFQHRVGSLKGGIEFLELCGFERIEGGQFLFLPQDKVDMTVLNSAGSALNSAITNPFFGLISKG